MTNKHYVVLTEDDRGPGRDTTFKVVCLAHDVSTGLKLFEAQALSNALNLESCHQQVGFGSDE